MALRTSEGLLLDHTGGSFNSSFSPRKSKVRKATACVIQMLERRLLLSASPTITLDNSSVNVGDTVNMTLNPNDDLGNSNVGNWNSDWGDGSSRSLDYTIDQSDSHSYSTDGHFTVNAGFYENDTSGYYSAPGVSIDVADPNYSAPAVSASLVTATPYVNFPVTINAAAVFDYSSDSITHTVDHFTVNWGDGAVDANFTHANSGNLTHTYTTAGTYSVSMTATDEWATSGSSSPISVTVTTPADLAPTVSLSSGTPHPVPGAAVTINGLASYWAFDPDTDTVGHFTVTWGDGSSPQNFTTSANSGSFSHTYATVGTYSVTATATDADTTSSASSALTVAVQPTVPEPVGVNVDGAGVDGFTGKLDPPIDGISSAGFSIPVDSSAAWGNGDIVNTADGATGANTVRNDFPTLVQGTNGVLFGQNGTNLEWFDPNNPSSPTAWVDQYDGLDTISLNSSTHELTVKTADGIQATFYDFSGASGALSGMIKTEKSPAGNTLTYNYNSSHQLESVVNAQVDGTLYTDQQFLYAYLTSGVNSGKVQTATLQQKSWDTGLGQSDPGYSTVRSSAYTYYTASTSDSSGGGIGNVGELELAETKDSGGTVLDSQYFRYYLAGDSDTHGYTGGIKYVLSSDSYNKLAAVLSGGTTPLNATAAQLSPYADDYYQYDASGHVTSIGHFTAAQVIYTPPTSSGNAGGDSNVWTRKSAVTNPSGTTTTTYFNAAGQQMLSVVYDGTHYWGSFTHYNSDGKADFTADPAAVNIPSLTTIEAYPDLLHYTSGNYQYLNDSAGEISSITYYTSSDTAATDTSPGGVVGMVKDTYLQHGETGGTIHQSHSTYYHFTAGSQTANLLAASTTYGDDAGTDSRTTSHVYTMYSGTVQTELQTVSKPTISSGQNGPGSADTVSTFYNTDGKAIWTKDAGGYVNYTAYDVATGRR